MFELKKMKQSGVQIRNVLAELDESVRVSGVSSYVYENICMVEQMAYGIQLNKNMPLKKKVIAKNNYKLRLSFEFISSQRPIFGFNTVV